MATQLIKYVWKIPKPSDPTHAHALMSAAYQTAIATQPNVKVVLVRSDIHEMTRTKGKFRRDKPHITIAQKTEQQVQNKTHEASHGYTASVKSSVVIDVKPSKYVKPDDTKDFEGADIWPEGLLTEEVAHNG